ncbi:MAG: hypothetical protein AAGA34_06215 [Pseudomonadota bacterium]
MSRKEIAAHPALRGHSNWKGRFLSAVPTPEVTITASHKRTNINDQLKRGEEPGLNRHWRGRFLDFLAESSNVSESARRAGINPSRAYKVRREEPEFARQWLAALWEGYVHLELEVLRRLREGDNSTSGNDKYDFANAIRLLNAHRDNAVRAQAEQRNVSAAEIRASIDRKVEAIRLQVQREKLKSPARS